MSLLLIISGPSGVGKNTLLARLKEDSSPFFHPISHTTRKPRGRERDGHTHYYIDREEFERMIKDGKFVEHSEHFDNYYGLSVKELSLAMEKGDVLHEIDVNGALMVKKKFPRAQLVFIKPPSIEELEKRLRRRGANSEESITGRLSRAEYEMSMADQYDHVVVNDDLEEAVSALKSLVATLALDRI